MSNQAQAREAAEPTYDPNYLIDAVIEKLHLRSDAALSRRLQVSPPMISKIRHRRIPVGASMLIRMHEVTDLSIHELRVLLGDRRAKYRISGVEGKVRSSERPMQAVSHS